MKRIQQARRATLVERVKFNERRKAMRAPDAKHTSAEEVLALEEADHRAALIAQIDFPWADDEDVAQIPDDKPRSEAQERRRQKLWKQWELEELLTDAVVMLDEIAYSQRRTCRCINPDACDCWGTIADRENKKIAENLVTRLRTVLGMPAVEKKRSTVKLQNEGHVS